MPDSTEAMNEMSDRLRSAGAPWRLDACGVTRSGKAISVLLHPDAFNPESVAVRVLMIAGLSGRSADVDVARIAAELLPKKAREAGLELAISVIPVANPDALSESQADPSHGYPPEGGFFDHSTAPEPRYLWRWISFAAPDLVLEIEAGSAPGWQVNAAELKAGSTLRATPISPADSLLAALGRGESLFPPDGPAPIPGLRLIADADSIEGQLDRLIAALGDGVERSPAALLLDARRARSPMEIARLLGRTYGHSLDPVIYTQGVAISGRLRLAELESEDDGSEPGGTVADIVAFVEEYVVGDVPPFDGNPGGQHLAGIVWCDELSAATGDPRYLAMFIDAADRYHSVSAGMPPPPSDDNFRTEDMFFTSAVLGRAFAISGNTNYIDMAARFLADADTQKPDGLFMHCQGADWNWGRSNGFAAMGYAEALTYMPADHELRPELIRAHTRQLEALLPLQQPDGTWLQVLDYPGSYHEMSVTCMVGYALARGIRLGWLDGNGRFRDSLERAWAAAAERIDDEGGLVDVCTGTGVQTSTREYLDRPAEFGFDHRGGSMALWFAVEVERLRRADNVRG
ncbi:MAG: glycoside hydrolase family 88 protein [Chloroflexi bacterium]|nr:glycoside hydrolase family 88 protein [Chloroflexota bacterium]